MSIYLTVDGGTTNTRIYLICKQKVTDSIKTSVGARDGKEKLKTALSKGISEILAKNNIHSRNVAGIIASGMITSELGLCNLPHIHLPAGVGELHKNMHTEIFADITDIPWHFIRGVKSDTGDLVSTDIMRGEETELMGMLFPELKSALYVLPGSHSKHISVDDDGKIISFKTMLSGELFSAIVSGTILKNSVDLQHTEIKREALFGGYEYCKAKGINEALFKTRVLSNIMGASKEECYSFLLGVILKDEIGSILDAKEKNVVIGGQKNMRDALFMLLAEFGDKKIVCMQDPEVARATPLGAVKILEANG